MTETPIPVPPGFRVIAHRGASGYAPENTLAAFRLAAEMKVADIEFDLQLTKDGSLVVVHDAALDRYGHPGCRVAEMTLAALKALDMGAWFGDGSFAGERMLTASELFETFAPQFIFHAEIKAPSRILAERLADLLVRHAVSERTVVTSFDVDILDFYRELAPGQPLGWLLRAGTFDDAAVARAVAAGFHQICPAASDVTPERVAVAKARVGAVRAHGIRTREDAERAVRAGCDGMTINWPDWLAPG